MNPYCSMVVLGVCTQGYEQDSKTILLTSGIIIPDEMRPSWRCLAEGSGWRCVSTWPIHGRRLGVGRSDTRLTVEMHSAVFAHAGLFVYPSERRDKRDMLAVRSEGRVHVAGRL